MFEPKLLRNWLNASLGNRMAWSAGTLALGFSVILTVVAFISISVILVRQLDANIRAQSDSNAVLGARALNAAVERVRELARHSMVVNGLVDSSGRQSYLVPLLEQDPLHARLYGAIGVCDSVGEIIVVVNSTLRHADCVKIAAGSDKQTPGLAKLSFVKDSGEIFLMVREPIYMEATSSVEGVVIGRVSVHRILEESGIWKHPALLEVALGGLRQTTGNGANDGRFYRVESVIPFAPGTPVKASLALVHGVAVAPLFKPAVAIVMVFIITIIGLVLGVAYLARRQGALLSVPLDRLKWAASRAAEGAPVELEPVLIRPDEIGTLATSVKHMADTLQQQGEILEDRVRQRTAELVAAKEATERINKELQAFTYSIAHDLKAPLRGIDGYSSLLLEEYSERLDDEGRRCLSFVRRATTNMGQLIDDLLAYSRLEQRDFDSSETNIGALIDTLVSEQERDIRESGIRVAITLEHLQNIHCDHDGMAMILRNLLGNAIKFTRNRPDPHIEVGGRYSENGVLIWVRDNGVGFDMQYHDRIFQIFQRLNRAEQYPGTGVGLAIVRKAAERMKGRVWAESVLGKGATFFVEVPK